MLNRKEDAKELLLDTSALCLDILQGTSIEKIQKMEKERIEKGSEIKAAIQKIQAEKRQRRRQVFERALFYLVVIIIGVASVLGPFVVALKKVGLARVEEIDFPLKLALVASFSGLFLSLFMVSQLAASKKVK